MSNNTALYYSERSRDPQEVRVLFFSASVHLYTVADNQLLHRFALAGTTQEAKNGDQFLYLDPDKTRYLQFAKDNPLASIVAKEVLAANTSLPRRLVKSKGLWVLGFLLAFFVGVYFLILSIIPYLGAKAIGRQQEIEMGDRIHAVLLAEAQARGEAIDQQGTNRLQDFADQLQLSKNYPIRLTLVKSNTVNAYALPGGNVVVYTGLLKKLNTPEALAALLAHECTHVNERHSLRSLLRSAASTIVLASVFGDASGIAAVLVNNAEALNGLRYSRSLEKEADSKGMELLLQNGIAAEGMRQLMQTLQQEDGKNPGSFSFLSTHPLTEDRLKETNRFLEKHPQQAGAREDLHTLFEKIKSSN